MTQRHAAPLRVVGLLSLAQVAFSLTGCASDGANADCPTMPVTNDPLDPELAAWREEAEAKGCVTPRGEPIE
jgi:hypothetical protein